MNQSSFIKYLLELNINISNSQLSQLERYYELLIEYNKVMNLTGITDHDEVYLKHFYDSLTICKMIDLNNVELLCDIGTGAGFPGLVLKILFPHLKITLIDSLNKRINFLNEVIKELKLDNIECIHSRIEEYGINNREVFDIVTCRAVAQTNILLEYASSTIKVGGYFIPLKGKMDNEDDYTRALKQLNIVEDDKEEFLLPIENSTRTIIKFKKIDHTPNKYPRKFSEIKKKPL